MKKIGKKVTIIALVLLFNSLALPTQVDAAAISPRLGGKYAQGVSNITVWLNYSSGIGFWEDFIVVGVNNWRNPGWSNKIKMTVVSSNAGSNIDFHRQNNSFWPLSGILAETRHFQWGSLQVNPRISNWNFTEIHINHDTFRNSNFSNEAARGTIIHELGHAFGLDENNGNINSVMCQYGAGRNVQRVQKVDNDAVNLIYP